MALMIGFAAANWTDQLKVTGEIKTGKVDSMLSYHTVGDIETKDIGQITGEPIGPPWKTIKITITNAYPGYIGWVWFDIHVLGTIPLIISEIKIDAPPELKIWAENLDHPGEPVIGIQLHPCHETGIKVYVKVFEDESAIPPIEPEQLTTYEFTVTFVLIQYNGYKP
jgi:hypothetical protein